MRGARSSVEREPCYRGAAVFPENLLRSCGCSCRIRMLFRAWGRFGLRLLRFLRFLHLMVVVVLRFGLVGLGGFGGWLIRSPRGGGSGLRGVLCRDRHRHCKYDQ